VALADVICAACLLDRSARHVRLPAITASACFVLLLAAADIHGGAAAVAGALAASAIALSGRRSGAVP